MIPQLASRQDADPRKYAAQSGFAIVALESGIRTSQVPAATASPLAIPPAA